MPTFDKPKGKGESKNKPKMLAWQGRTCVLNMSPPLYVRKVITLLGPSEKLLIEI